MTAERRIIEFLKERREEGALQSEISKKLKLSKSTVSEILQRLEGEGLIVREKVAGKSYRVWFFEFAPKPIEGVVRVGILKASEYPHVLLACDEMNARVKVFDSALDLTKSLAMGLIDIGVSPFVTQTMFALTLRSIKIHCIVAFNGSGVVMKRDLKECKTFATSELSAMESNLKLFLEKLGFKISELSFKYVHSPENMIKSFKACEFDAIAIWEPYFTMLKDRFKHMEFREIIGDYPCCSLASNVKFYKSQRDLLEEFLEKLKRFAENFDRDRASKLMADVMGFSRRVVLKSFNNYKFSAELNEKDFRFLENYGLKLTNESIRKIAADL